MNNDNIYDVVIIGSGPSGLAAAIYAERAKLKTITIEKQYMSGGQVLNTYEVDNYPGLPEINGFDMGQKFRQHAEKLGSQFVKDEVLELELMDKIKKVHCKKNEFLTKTVIIATGAQHRLLDVKGEKELYGKGVSYCATCDGAFYKEKTVAVVGGGDVALEDAIFLSRLCKKVYLIHRRDEFRGVKILQEKVFSINNIEIIWDTVVDEICGEGEVSSINVCNVKTNEKKSLDVDGVFVAIGIIPNSHIFEKHLQLDDGNYIVATEDCKTSVEGVFVAGDVRTKALRQIVTAVSDGANAITSIEKYLATKF
ncbi:thioredoxin-disulfide reductase [uncultured Tyzzerella sp.]|uniref:thioredoxin-disulfide reductase n=1 Tax=uncultured Tyzzerella sp. TaxID=2321398 RepID=UPI002942B041|nr:thioredoxin-disulfide reductase [uncultured Tyzzerella sp.]